MVVDDDDDSRGFVAMVLGMLGFTVITATDGDEALALARDCHPCLILLDLIMPRMDGFSFRAAQLQNPELAGIPVLVMSALDAAQIHGRIGSLPALLTPVEVDDLINHVVRLCQPTGAS